MWESLVKSDCECQCRNKLLQNLLQAFPENRKPARIKETIWNLMLVSLISPVFSKPEIFQVACLKECFD